MKDLLDVARIEEGMNTLFNNEKKVPYTDKGADSVSNVVTKVLTQATPDILSEDRPFVVTVESASDQPDADRATRQYNGVSFVAFYSGAINKVRIVGTISI